MEQDEKKEVEGKAEEEEEQMKVKKEKVEQQEEEVKKNQSARVKTDPDVGRLVMTVDGKQKQLPFGPDDLLTTATMLDGDKVRHCSVNRTESVLMISHTSAVFNKGYL